ncbi:MAG: hypothetical protein JWO28_52 [Hyphomicrobiales bacterium]|nr:hypothetical protein [Hyphomicrobiales bacterium]
MTTTAYRANYGQIDWSRPITIERKPYVPPARSDLPCPMIVSDSMGAVEHVDGKFYESKSAFRAVTKARGLTEVGNDPARFNRPPKPKADEAGIDRAVERAFAKVGS